MKLTWDRGFVVAVECTALECVSHLRRLFSSHPIHTIRLTDWHGIARSLPPNPREALPFLKRLELSASVLDIRVPDASWIGQTILADEIKKIIPGVEVVYYNQFPPGRMVPESADPYRYRRGNPTAPHS